MMLNRSKKLSSQEKVASDIADDNEEAAEADAEKDIQGECFFCGVSTCSKCQFCHHVFFCSQVRSGQSDLCRSVEM